MEINKDLILNNLGKLSDAFEIKEFKQDRSSESGFEWGFVIKFKNGLMIQFMDFYLGTVGFTNTYGYCYYGGPFEITYPEPFYYEPTITLTPYVQGGVGATLTVSSKSNAGFACLYSYPKQTSLANVGFNYIAIGVWKPDYGTSDND